MGNVHISLEFSAFFVFELEDHAGQTDRRTRLVTRPMQHALNSTISYTQNSLPRRPVRVLTFNNNVPHILPTLIDFGYRKHV